MLLVARGQRVKRDLGQNILPARFAPRSAKWRECEGETRKILTAINKMGKTGNGNGDGDGEGKLRAQHVAQTYKNL